MNNFFFVFFFFKQKTAYEMAQCDWSSDVCSSDLGEADGEEWKRALKGFESWNALVAIRPAARGDVTRTNVLWRFYRSLPDVPSPLLYQDVLYIVRDGGILTSLDPATGEVLHQGRLPLGTHAYYASPIAAAGKLYLASEGGT